MITLSHSNSKDDNIFATPFKGTNYGIHPTYASSISEWINRKQNISEKKLKFSKKLKYSGFTILY